MLLALTLALLSGCETIPSDLFGTTPAVKEYTPEQQEQAAREIEGGTCPTLNMFTTDYGVMRDEARTVEGER